MGGAIPVRDCESHRTPSLGVDIYVAESPVYGVRNCSFIFSVCFDNSRHSTPGGGCEVCKVRFFFGLLLRKRCPLLLCTRKGMVLPLTHEWRSVRRQGRNTRGCLELPEPMPVARAPHR